MNVTKELEKEANNSLIFFFVVVVISSNIIKITAVLLTSQSDR